MITLDGDHLTFRHPLMRSAAYHDAGRADRRAAHRALADALPVGSPARAWHLARAAVGPDEEVARALDEAAAVTARRGAPSVAGRSWELASRLSPEPPRPRPPAAPRRLRRPRRRDGRGRRSPARPGRRASSTPHPDADDLVERIRPPPVALPAAVVERRRARGRRPACARRPPTSPRRHRASPSTC